MADDPAPPPDSLAERLDLKDLVAGLVGDLRDLRAGTISVKEAHARAELAKQILRAVQYVIQAQKYLEGQLKALPGADHSQPTRKQRRRAQTPTMEASDKRRGAP